MVYSEATLQVWQIQGLGPAVVQVIESRQVDGWCRIRPVDPRFLRLRRWMGGCRIQYQLRTRVPEEWGVGADRRRVGIRQRRMESRIARHRGERVGCRHRQSELRARRFQAGLFPPVSDDARRRACIS